MPIVDTIQGDVTMGHHHIVIAMNSDFLDVRGIGSRRLEDYESLRGKLPLGSTVSFEWDKGTGRELHLLICHKLGEGGWDGADRHVRFGLDQLAYRHGRSERGYGIVEIGKGRVGRRDGADPTAIHTAMATSFLPLRLFILPEPEPREAQSAVIIPMRPLRVYDRVTGEHQLAA